MLLLGLLIKLPCASGDWSDGRAYRRFCYTDIVPLFQANQLDDRRIPYIEAPNEYPVVLGMLMWLTALPVDAEADFFLLNALVLSIAAGAAAWSLHRMVGTRSLLFAASPTMVLYGFLNWDLIPVAVTVFATAALIRGRPGWSGGLLGLGAATKLFPGFLALPFALDQEHRSRPREGVRLVAIAAGVWLVLNIPVAALDFREWSLFFRFNAARAVDWGTLWFVGCHRITGELICPATGLVNAFSAAAFVGGALLLWRLKVARQPEFPRWTFALPLLVLFLLTTKVYSPQYSLWLLPLFALVDPDLKRFVAFEVTDVAVFITEFSWLGRYTGFGGLPVGLLEVAVGLRAVVLLAYVARFVSEEVTSFPRVEGSWATETVR